MMLELGNLRIAAAYIRCSTDRQEDSPEVQRGIITEYAAKCGFVIPQELWFIDEDVSGGKPMHQRPEGSKLLALATDRKRRPFETVLIVRPDRAFRDHIDQETVIVLLMKADCEIAAAKADMSRDTAMQRAMLRVQAVFAQAERELTGERIKEHNLDRHHKGLHTHGRPSLGLTIGQTSNDPLRVVSDELPRAIRIFEYYADTCGNSRETARRLNAEGIRPRSGKAWTGSMVRKVVMGPHYRRMQTYDGILLPKPQLIPETVPPDLVERVDSILAAQYGHWFRGQEGRRMGPNLQGTYSGLIVCGKCGSPVDANVRPGAESTRFRCRSTDKAEGGCKGGSFHAPTIDHLIGQAILSRLQNFRAAQTMPEPVRRREQKEKRCRDPRVDLAEQRRRVNHLWVIGEYTQEQRDTEVARIAREEALLGPAEPEPIERPKLSAQHVADLLANWADLWTPDMHSMAKRELLTAVLGIGPRGIRITKETTFKRERKTAKLIVSVNARRLHDEPLLSEIAGSFLYSLSSHPASTPKDHHKGYAVPIGGVVAYEGKISPSGVGFDIGCGNKAARLDIPAAEVRANIKTIMDDVWKNLSFGMGRNNDTRVEHELFDDDIWRMNPVKTMKQMAQNQLGTIGSGNHYVDLFADEQERVWVGVHFGSRGLGHKTATYFLQQGGAKDGMDVEPLVLDAESPLGSDYLACMALAGRYAYAGRDWVCSEVARILGANIVEEVHNHHNYAWKETHQGRELWVVRKGATPAFPGQKGFVGGSMGDQSVILEGVESEEAAESLYSTVHGAGRVMSRTAARGKIDRRTGEVKSPGRVSREMMREWIDERGVELRGAGTDESPHCYKRLPEVLAHHGNSIRVLHTLTPLGVAMAGENEVDPYKD